MDRRVQSWKQKKSLVLTLEGYVACVQIDGPIRSFYREKGELKTPGIPDNGEVPKLTTCYRWIQKITHTALRSGWHECVKSQQTIITGRCLKLTVVGLNAYFRTSLISEMHPRFEKANWVAKAKPEVLS